MKCEKYSNLIDDLIEGELDSPISEEVNLHLFACAECASQAAVLRREKEIYARYLFEIEPPIDLPMRFQTRLEAKSQTGILAAQITFGTKILAFWRLNPTLTTAVLLVLAGLGLILFNFALSKSNQPNIYSNPVADNKIQLALPVLPKKENPLPKDEVVTAKPKVEKVKKEIQPKPIEVKQIVNQAAKPKAAPKIPQLSEEERLQIKEIQALEIETVKQMEKVELLLRSFRNIRQTEGSEQYDISYEKQQARKLLQNNVVLRQKAEIYGTLLTEEMLSKVEPYLLDIANLELNPASEKVLEIKERVRNQNIIASLQAF
jgi:hypothetical protein